MRLGGRVAAVPAGSRQVAREGNAMPTRRAELQRRAHGAADSEAAGGRRLPSRSWLSARQVRITRWRRACRMGLRRRARVCVVQGLLLPAVSARTAKSSQDRSRAAAALPPRLTGEGALIDSDRRKGLKSKEVSSSGFQLREWLRQEAEAWLTDPGRPGITPAWGWARAENARALLSPVSSPCSAIPARHAAPKVDMGPQLGRTGRSRAARIFDRGRFGSGTRLAAGERMVPRGPLNGGRAR
jgi:hypothetical protein